VQHFKTNAPKQPNGDFNPNLQVPLNLKADFMKAKFFKLSAVLILLTNCACNAIQDSNTPWHPNDKLVGLAKVFETGNTRRIIVDSEGRGDFNSIQSAIDSIPKNNNQRIVVLIKPGFYAQRVLIPENKPFITLRGKDPFKTTISYNLHHDMLKPDGSGIYRSDCATLIVNSPDFIMENLTIENTYGSHPQALAAKLVSERAIAVNCRFLGGQDTLMANLGRQYYLNCYIEGGTDFIYGYSQTLFDHCLIHSKESSHITAHAATEPNLPTGFVFYHCRVTTSDGIMTDLGRPWRPYAKVIYYDCWLDKGIKPVGWNNWRDPNREKTAFFAEFRSSGPGANPSARVKWSRQLTAIEAEEFLPENFMTLDGHTTDPWLQKILDFRKTACLKN
jgi:pectinesterase